LIVNGCVNVQLSLEQIVYYAGMRRFSNHTCIGQGLELKSFPCVDY